MIKTVIGVFDIEENAQSAIVELQQLGYDPKDMSIVMKDVQRASKFGGETGTRVVGGAATGAATGAVVGGLTGLLVGVGAIAIPGLGAFLVGGPLAVTLGLTGTAATTASGAATGALAGGLIGALVSLGIPEEQAQAYEERIRAGGVLLAVPTFSGKSDEVEDVMSENGAADVNSLNLPEKTTDDHTAAGSMDEEDYTNRRYAYRHRTDRRLRRIR